MVKIMCGLKGTGKTKELIKMANEDIKTSDGDIVFIEDNSEYILNLNHNIRYINAMEFDIKDTETFHGFLCGIIAEDYDIRKIYIDGLYNIVKLQNRKLKNFLDELEELGEKFNIDFVISVSCDPKEVSNELENYII
ncbi:hypothetical protein L21TH_0337 [Caldisalinibacter kiritimatiensis]|uniref:ATP-binding protein n=2 Tax=Caldisalinibacter kiritimatiensis TaxID=1304284 RepID=R1AWN4_9FIRM|nr:hypothetical protein L21TH_0337 [Caldisalinibacter kiritimatiensis]